MPSENETAHQPGRIPHKPSYRPDIEGLRALAVLLVVAFHLRVPGFGGGFIGVDIFFVLSGYLITGLLVDEMAKRGTIDFWNFYARRARRLLPALAFMLLITMLVSAFLYAPFEQQALTRAWMATAFYASNIDFAYRSLFYNSANAADNPLLHTWSLGIEEQFYLVWPWLILLGMWVLPKSAWIRKTVSPGPHILLALLALTTFASFMLSLHLTNTEGAWAFYLSPTRAWEFGAGGLAALTPLGMGNRKRTKINSKYENNAALGWLALIGIGIVTVAYTRETAFPGIAALVPVLSTVVLLRTGATPAAGTGDSVNRLLSLQPMQCVGKLSYSWYLWHWPALVFAAGLMEPLSAGGRTVAVTLSLIAAYGSYRYIENPIRYSKILAVRPSRSLYLAIGISAVTILLAGLWWHESGSWRNSPAQASFTRVANELPLIYKDHCDHFGRARLTPCVYGNETSKHTAVLVGDSHAGQLFPAVHQAVEDSGWRLVVLTLSACPFVDIPAQFNRTLGRMYPECVQWRRSAIKEIQRLKPDITFVASVYGSNNSAGAWEHGVKSVLGKLQRYSDRTVLVLDPPLAGVDVPVCLARAAWRPGNLFDPDCKPRESAATMRQLAGVDQRAAHSYPDVEVLDIRDQVCVIGECDATVNGLIRYRDESHLSVEFATTLSHNFLNYLREK